MVMQTTPPSSKPGLDPSLLIGVPSIDREHYDLVTQLDVLTSNPHAHPDGDDFSRVLGQLGAQISAHQINEEEILRAVGMSADEIAQHVFAHDEILREYAELNFDLMAGKVPGRCAALALIRGWIIDHVRLYDLEIRNYLAKD